MHPRQRADDLEMAQFLGADVHQQILAIRVFTIEALDRILHRCGEFSVRSAKLLKEHIAKTRVRFVDADSEHELLDMMVHRRPRWRGVEYRLWQQSVKLNRSCRKIKI